QHHGLLVQVAVQLEVHDPALADQPARPVEAREIEDRELLDEQAGHVLRTPGVARNTIVLPLTPPHAPDREHCSAGAVSPSSSVEDLTAGPNRHMLPSLGKSDLAREACDVPIPLPCRPGRLKGDTA